MSLSTCFRFDQGDSFYQSFYEKFAENVKDGRAKELYKTYIKSDLYFNYPIQALCSKIYTFNETQNYVLQIWDLIDKIIFASLTISFIVSTLLLADKEFQKTSAMFFFIALILTFRNYDTHLGFLKSSDISIISKISLFGLLAENIFKRNHVLCCNSFLQKVVKGLVVSAFAVFLVNNYKLIYNPYIYLFSLLAFCYYKKSNSAIEAILIGASITLCFNQWLFWMNFIPVGRGFSFLLASFLVPVAVKSKKTRYALLLPIILLFHLNVGLLILSSLILFEVIKLNFKSAILLVSVISSIGVSYFIGKYHFGWLPFNIYMGLDAIRSIFLGNSSYIWVIAQLLLLVLIGKVLMKKEDNFYSLYAMGAGCFLIILEEMLSTVGVDRYTIGLGKIALVPLYLCPFLFSSAFIYFLLDLQIPRVNSIYSKNYVYCIYIILILGAFLFCKNPYNIQTIKKNETFCHHFNRNHPLLNDPKIFFPHQANPTDPTIWYNYLKYKINSAVFQNKKYVFEKM